MKSNCPKTWLLFWCFATPIAVAAENRSLIPEDYQERITLNLNSTFFLTGESILFSAFCIDARNRRPSELSSVAYVELIDEKGVAVLQTKIGLSKGWGTGDFFLSSSLSSGNYTLIAYTRWMKNFPYRFFFHEEITVINPFRKPISVSAPKSVHIVAPGSVVSGKNDLEIDLPKKEFRLRDLVEIGIRLKDPLHGARLSISVRKVEKEIVVRHSLANYYDGQIAGDTSRRTEELKQLKYLPELRGQLITGTVRIGPGNQPAVEKIVSLSVPAKDYLFHLSVTDSTGRFYFITDQPTSSQNIVLKAFDCPGCLINMDEDFISNYDDFIPSALTIEPSLRSFIERQSIISQIENAYYPFKQDSTERRQNARFYGAADHAYLLDQYVRFPVMEDILREFVTEVYVRKKDDSFSIKAMNGRTGIAYREDPLMLLDGIPVADPGVIMGYNPLRIEKIEIVTRRYFYGPLETNGIISFQTYDGDAADLPLQDAVRQLYIGIQPRKLYYAPDYKTSREELTRIPDYRVQLFWDGCLLLDPGKPAQVDFFTSDIEGEFEITVEGMQDNGGFFFQKEMIRVSR